MKLIASVWTIPIALCLLGAAFADELTTSGDAKSLGFTKPPKLFSGGGGLVSTAPDYLRFCQMLLNDGELDGVRLLTPQAVKEMTTNALPPDIRIFGNEVGPLAGRSFGLGFAIRTDPVSSWTPGAVGSFSWAGLWGTYFWIDPAEELVGL
jgi:CubicO group peptidase (beta-lactamase class C family)